MRKIVFIFCHLRFHLHHIRSAFLAQFIQALHLSQHPLAFVQFLACYPNACLSIGSIHIFLHHVDGSVVLNLLHRRGRIIPAQLSLLQGVDGGETIEDIQFGIKLIVVVERRYIIISIGFRVDVSSPGILSLHAARNGRQESCHSMLVILLALAGIHHLPLHLRGVLHGVFHAVVKAPALCRGTSRPDQPSYQYSYSFHNLLHFGMIRTRAVPKQHFS